MHVYLFDLNNWAICMALLYGHVCPRGYSIHNQLAIKPRYLTGHICYVRLILHHDRSCISVLYLFSSILVICHFNIYLAEAGVMNEAGYAYSISSI